MTDLVAHDTVVWFAKTIGLFYLLAMAGLALTYACWPSKQREFDQAASDILSQEDRPWR
ncbi:MAG: cbb3-type cytochrome c oxidase subunit 3 [Hyphomicrobiales bacterium]|jgi:cytochrome c oxidase cbb3-type subunit 4|uniref:cbb3-type cytochrome c oxidase subunit 3 n=1 Tax=Rhabdaerophilum calidifontis TaxID=2604328 RepID=UPI0012384CE8|nr:cbb3-type cytochrome c oxidase subunit 3 [Rhabdaerophilum calidifontis]MCA1952953.1 cbb3-type cytochrome c oxidase subunit 3 [Hyphomicrobiales bacterium]MCA1999922.1 cbb3-type cytochrome c oxidase subunit 3 [Hyphomicrobiales bacterium]